MALPASMAETKPPKPAASRPFIIHPYSPLDHPQSCQCRHYQASTAQIDRSSWPRNLAKFLPYPKFTSDLDQTWPIVGYRC